MRFLKIVLLALGLILVIPASADARKKKDAKNVERVEQQVEQAPSMAELDAETLDLVNNILNCYTDWENVSFSGKIRIPSLKLPVTPTVRIYAEKDRLFQLSLSAPFLGELGRIEITDENFTAINKYNKTYVQESLEKINEIYPGALGDLQNLFLGRMVILGRGVFSLEILGDVTFAPTEDGQWLMMPRDVEESSMKYGYVVLSGGRTGALFGYVDGRPESVTLTYGYNSGLQMTVDVEKGDGKAISGTLDFSSVKWGGNRMSSVNLDRYRRVGIGEFVKNYR